ncbi:ISL3 family transposase [Mycolicibacterium cyprinidarum]|uniref:ISL3 family transposase n=1 Tax=Mycolicibacterium cyprinidarum TaxID=2860311 RepID=A0ABQ4V4D0_9MYCO|nr:ISL3 family transposase [Mycobacterium sp.]GJF09854.1 ISL3 family transposase [Mycolicibacterium sp. NGTWSNA01]GJF13454.1 ISL3 family transposase [Mycolicibacterium sp. NGTWS0302]GJF16330.1 ISL3 family transposase [Mycolicibacterium sp. NGTWS1803]
MRVSTAFNRLLQIPGASVTDVVIAHGTVEVSLRPRARLLHCPCGKQFQSFYDRRKRRWRHLDLAGRRLWLVYEIRRIDCPDCGVVTEELPWARPGARHTRDFEDTVLWLAQRTDRTSVATLMRCAWETITAIINRGVAELLDARRLHTLYRIGVDEICYRHPHRYLTIIGDHDTGTVVDIQPGRSKESLTNFYASHPDSVLDQIEAVSMDVSSVYTSATKEHLPEAVICYDGFHLMQWVQRALDRVFAESIRLPGYATADWKAARWALRTGENKLTDDKRALVNKIARDNRRIGRAWTLKEQARDLYRYDHQPGVARKLLKSWITAAKRSRIPAFVALGKRFQVHFEPILAAIELGISNALIEGINAKIRLINARGYGHHSARTLTSMIYLCIGGLQVKLPMKT